MKLHEADIFQKRIIQPLEDADQELDQVPEVESVGKSKVACICPGCGKMHVMKIRWIGRGVPRKFCQHCKDRQTPLDDED